MTGIITVEVILLGALLIFRMGLQPIKLLGAAAAGDVNLK